MDRFIGQAPNSEIGSIPSRGDGRVLVSSSFGRMRFTKSIKVRVCECCMAFFSTEVSRKAREQMVILSQPVA